MVGVILAAGYGKRLAKISGNTSKCLIELNGTCLIDHNIQLLVHFGVNRDCHWPQRWTYQAAYDGSFP